MTHEMSPASGIEDFKENWKGFLVSLSCAFRCIVTQRCPAPLWPSNGPDAEARHRLLDVAGTRQSIASEPISQQSNAGGARFTQRRSPSPARLRGSIVPIDTSHSRPSAPEDLSVDIRSELGAGVRTSKRSFAQESAFPGNAETVATIRYKEASQTALQRQGPKRPCERHVFHAPGHSFGHSWLKSSSPIILESGPASLRSLFTRSVHNQNEDGLRVLVTQLAPRQNRRLGTGQLPRVGTAAALVHDLNNLLSIVHINLQLLDREISDEDLRTMVKDAQDANELCNELIKGLLAERTGQVTRPPPLDINEELAAIGNLIQQILGPEIQVEQDLAKDLGTTSADPTLLRNACLNLVANARHAMTSGGRLSIATSNIEIAAGTASSQIDAKPGAYVRLSIRDSGSGIPPETLRRIFEPYFTTKTQGGSLGLGLPLVREFCERFEGFVRVESNVGKGTTVSINLPRHDD